METSWAMNNGPADHIGQVCLPLSFGLADVVQSISGQNSSMEASNLATDMMHTLASKVLHTSLFIVMEWSSPDIQPAKVFHLASRILEGRTSPSSLIVAQAIANLPITEDLEKAARRQVRLAAEAITYFDAHVSGGQESTTFYNSPASAGTTYLSDVATRLACERQGIRPSVVHMVNDSSILVVSQAGGNIMRVAPKCVMMDSGAQPVIIGKKNLRGNCN